MAVDKNQAVIDFLNQCPQIAKYPMFFNCINAEDNSQQIVTLANDSLLNKPYIDGSVLKRYSFTVICFKSISTAEIPKVDGVGVENIADMFDVQGVLDWIVEKANERYYPDFGDDCEVDDMTALSDNPRLDGIDTTSSPALARYSFTIQIDYIDESKAIWKNGKE